MNCRFCQSACREYLTYRDIPARSQHFPEHPAKDGITLNVVQCTGCGLIQLDNEPVSYFREVIRAVGVSPEMAALRRKQFADFARRHQLLGQKVLETGCGNGDYLHLIQSSGMDAYGTEYGDIPRQEKVEKIYFETGKERHSAGPFAGFFLLNWLEHIPAPRPFLDGIRNNLRPNAAGLVEVPNYDMIFEKKMFAEFTIDHLYYFTASTLRTALETNGFEVLSMQETFHRYILSCEVRLRQLPGPEPFVKAENALYQSIDDFIHSHHSDGNCAVWGAGHQSLLMLSLAPVLKNHICRVLDSASFKQGKYTPATGLPICSPESLHDGTIATVLVIAGGYSEEIVRILQKDYPEVRHIGILREDGVEYVPAKLL